MTFYIHRNIIEKKSEPKVIFMNSALTRASEYFFNFSVAFYFGYASFAMKKSLVRAQKSF